MIICLGLQVLEALGYCEGGRVICTDDNKPKGRLSLRELLDAGYHFELEIGDSRIKTAVVFHPGANMNRNRKDEKTVYADWKRIRKIYEQMKGC